MKKLIILSLCFMAMASKCKKKEAKDYLPGTWAVLTYKENGVDKTTDFQLVYQGYKITFDAKGNYTEFYRLLGAETTIKGTWTLESSDLIIKLVDNDPNSSNKIRTFNVLQPISETQLDVGEGSKEYDLRKQ